MLATKGLLLAAAGLLCWVASTQWISATYERSDPARATAVDGSNGVALLGLAQAALVASPADYAMAEHYAWRLLRVRPGDGRGFRILARVAAERGDMVRAERLMTTALRLCPADVETRGWMADVALVRGDLAEALAHVDAILRVSPQRSDQLFPIMQGWLLRTDAMPVFATLLGSGPPWRSGFIAAVATNKDPAPIHALALLVQSLRRAPAPATALESGTVIERLIRERDYELAYLLWRPTLPDPLARTTTPYNGDFEHTPSGVGFDWRLQRVVGATVGVEKEPARDGRALRVSYDGRRVSTEHAYQLMILQQGQFYLSGEALLADLRSERGIEWYIECLGEERRRLGGSLPMHGTQAWTAFSFAFAVPADDCPAQRLVLATRGRIHAEQVISGTAWFDNFKIESAPVFHGSVTASKVVSYPREA